MDELLKYWEEIKFFIRKKILFLEMFSFWIIKLDVFFYRDILKFYIFFKELRILNVLNNILKDVNNLGRDLKFDR